MNHYIQEGTKKEIDNLKKAYEDLNKKMKILSEQDEFKKYEEKLKVKKEDEQLIKQIHEFYMTHHNKIINNHQLSDRQKEDQEEDLLDFMENEFGICMPGRVIMMLKSAFNPNSRVQLLDTSKSR